MSKIFIEEAIKRLSTSRTTIYKHIKKLNIGLQKDGKKTYLTQEQFDAISAEIKNHVSTSSKDFGTVDTLKKQIENQKIEIEALKTDREKKGVETQIATEKYRALELENAKLEGRSESLELQNNKLHLTVGGLAEQVKNVVLENQKLIEPVIETESAKSGVFQRMFEFLKK